MLPSVETCAITDEVCCTRLWDNAETLREIAAEALDECMADGCAPIASYVGVFDPTYSNDGNYLAVWLADASPVITTSIAASAFPRLRYTYVVKLVESGWPTLGASGATLSIPEAERMQALSRHAYSHIEKVYRALSRSISEHTFPCQSAQITGFRPTMRAAGLVGWQISILMED